MAYQITWTLDARLDLNAFGKPEQVTILEAPTIYLRNEPERPSRRRKRLEPNPLGAPWELRLDEAAARVYYDVDEAAGIVRVLRVGRKIRNRVFIRGVATDLREHP